MVEKKDSAQVDADDDDIDIDLDYLLEEGLEVTGKEESAKKPVRKKKVAEEKKPASTKKASAKAPVKKEAKKDGTAASAKPAAKKETEKKPAKKSEEITEAPSKKSADNKKDEKTSARKKADKKDEKKTTPKKVAEKPKEEVLVVDDEEEEGVYVAKLKPALPDEVQSALREREYRKRRKPDFRRQEWFRYKRLGTAWRRPRGLQSKMRRHFKYRPNVVSIGYGTNKLARNLHPSGFEEVLVYRPQDLEEMDPTLQAARIGHSVGSRKREMIEKRAKELGIRVLNRSG